MYRIAGGLLIVLSAFLCGYMLVIKEKKHIEQLDIFTRLIKHIYKQIEAFNLPLGDILKNTDAELLSLINEGSGYTGDITLSDALLVTPKEKKVIMSFFSGLGRCYRDEQLKMCKYYSDEIEALLAGRRKEYPKKRKLFLTLSLCAALGLVILMI
ncbi:MAG: hypothetical protein E7671_01950 [Ruminococcaceae bacterium]|nr:hypothetical protein [Oscillospiraceae bacterium]